MALLYCAGSGCERFISVSVVPGGNPTALAEPEKFAIVYARCGCGAHVCDRCTTGVAGGRCPKCKAALPLSGPPPLVAPAPGPAAPVAGTSAPARKPWWRFWGSSRSLDVAGFRGFSADGARFAYTTPSFTGGKMSGLWVAGADGRDPEMLAMFDPDNRAELTATAARLRTDGFVATPQAPPDGVRMTAELTSTPPMITLAAPKGQSRGSIGRAPYPPTDRAELWAASPDGSRVAIHIFGPVRGVGPTIVHFFHLLPTP